MPVMTNVLLGQYVEEIRKIYGKKLKSVILYGSYARGDFKPDSDIDIMILVDSTEMEIEELGKQLSRCTYDFNEEHDTDIKPIAKVIRILESGWEFPLFIQMYKRKGCNCMEQPDKGCVGDYAIVLKRQRVICASGSARLRKTHIIPI